MRRKVSWLLGAAIVAGGIGGCVADPYYNDRYRDGSNSPYDQYGYHPPRHDDREHDQLPTLVCASKDGRGQRCHTDFPIRRAEVDKRYSGSPCEYGRTWGYDSDEVWVDRGCRARFVLYPAGRWR